MADDQENKPSVSVTAVNFTLPKIMSQTKATKARPLGSLRHPVHHDTIVPKFPPVRNGSMEKPITVQGNAMSVPPVRVSPEREENKVSARSPTHRPITSKSDTSNQGNKTEESADKKELKEAMVREKQLKQKIMSLQKVIDDLQAQLREKEKIIADLHEQFKRQEENYKEQLEKEKLNHQETREELNKAKEEIKEKIKLIDEFILKHEKELKETIEKWEAKYKELGQEKDKEISIRDEKINKLKLHMAEALKGNSWERQQQLDELTKELTRLQEETDLLRLKLKQKGKEGDCANCRLLSNKANQSESLLREHEQTIKDLKSMCAKQEQQLSHQDLLLKQFAESKGHKDSCENCQVHAAKCELLQKTVNERDGVIKDLQNVCSRFEKQLSQQDVLLREFLNKKGNKAPPVSNR